MLAKNVVDQVPTLPVRNGGQGAFAAAQFVAAVGVGAGSTSLRISRWMMIELGRSWSVALYDEITFVPALR